VERGSATGSGRRDSGNDSIAMRPMLRVNKAGWKLAGAICEKRLT
jgi:hypothetical protein